MTSIVQRAATRLRRCLFSLATALWCGLATTAYAEVHVEGSPSAVRVTTNQDAIADVLWAFTATFNVQYRTAIPLDAAAQRLYSGSFRQVVSRLLDGYSYVIKRDQETIEVVVFGRHGEIPTPRDQCPTDQRYIAAMALGLRPRRCN